MLRAGQPGATDDQIDEMVSARLERQTVLHRDDPPMLWLAIDEGALRRELGNPKVMHDQLHAFIETAKHPRIAIQVVPSTESQHAGLAGAFAVATLNSDPPVLYLESARAGHITDRPEDVQEIMNIWEAIRLKALPDRASLSLIAKVMEQWT